MARKRRREAQTKMFAAGIPRGHLSVVVTPEFERATKNEREINGALHALKYEAREQLQTMFREAAEGKAKVDEGEVRRLNTFINEIENDLQRIAEEVEA